MSLAINKPKLDNLTQQIWKAAERLRGKFKAYEYQNIILPILVLRRLECVLIAWRDAKAKEVAAADARAGKQRSAAELATLLKSLEQNPAQCPFYNTTNWTLRRIYDEDHALLEDHFRAYVNGFSPNVQEVFDKFDYKATIGKMVANNRLAPIINLHKELDIGPDKISNLEMGYIYEELLRRFSEQSGEEAGEHFTPREVIRLMVELLEIPPPSKHTAIYDPACGTGGMLSVAKEHLLARAKTDEERRAVERNVTIHGQELSRTNYAICQADMLIKADPQAKVYLGNSLIPHDERAKEPGDRLASDRFDFMLSNPPFGVTWGGKDGYEAEARKFEKTRYAAGMPPVNNGAFLFLQTMLAKMKPPEQGGSRIAIIFNGSPLSNGDCGQDESEIRRWIIENDWLDAIVMLPDQLFYNTGIFTYIWLLRNEKPESHKGRVMIIDARGQFEKEPKSFGNKRNRITEAHRAWIEERYREDWVAAVPHECVKVFRNEDFAYHKVSVVFWQFDENDKPAVITEPYERAFTAASLKKDQEFFQCELTYRWTVERAGKRTTESLTLKPTDSAAARFKAVVGSTVSVTDVEWTHRHYVADDEYIPYQKGKAPKEYIEEFLKREVARPIIRWSDSPQLGYEFLPNKYFFKLRLPPPSQERLAELLSLQEAAAQAVRELSA
jgi:type I restriction enzyme M protein